MENSKVTGFKISKRINSMGDISAERMGDISGKRMGEISA